MFRFGKPALACLVCFAVWAGAAAQQPPSGRKNGPSTPGKTGKASSAQTAAPESEAESRRILVRAIQLHQAGEFDEAIREYQKYLAIDPGNFVARANLGAALAHQGRYAEAIEEYEKALKIQPGNPQVELNLALAHYKSLQLEEAASELQPLHTAAPSNLQIALLLGDCYFRLGKYKEVVQVLEPMEATQHQQPALDYLLGTALINDGQIAKGELLVNKILRNGDSPEAHLMLGDARLAIHDVPGAIKQLSEAIKLDPKIPLAHWFYGEALLDAGQRPQAMEAFREELAIDPNEFDPNLLLGAMLSEGGQYKEAQPYLARALRVRPDSPRARYQVALVQIGLGNLEQARKTLKALVKDFPNFLEAHTSLATVYYRLHMKQDGDRQRAIVAKLYAEVQARKRATLDKANRRGAGTLPGGSTEEASGSPANGKKP